MMYYSKSDRVIPGKDLPPASDQPHPVADTILQDIYSFQGVKGKVPRLPDGHLDWDHRGPQNDVEWAWAMNRHYPVQDLVDAYFKTGYVKYIPYIDEFVRSWIIKSWPYPAKSSRTAMWRGLEVSFRVKTWAKVFYDLWNTEMITPATRLLILISLPQHAHYARNFHAGGNWLTMEISGLATVASAWPEFRDAPGWMEYSMNTMVASMKEQVYPDGVQNELSSSYHNVALSNFSQFADICKRAGVPMPEYYTRTLVDMWNYLGWTIRPNGTGLLNNDSDLNFNREKVLRAAEKYNSLEWKYIASNGKEGTMPLSGASCVFPWAGHLISRSGFDPDAHWLFFDMGPWGTGHQHNDKLHISVSAYGRDLLVDAGRFAYNGTVADKFRKYALGSQGHNVVLVDGKGQAPGPRKTETPLNEDHYFTGPDFDYGSESMNTFAGLEGRFSHTRSVLYVKGKFWVVADYLKTNRPRDIDVLWHWHPECKVGTGKDGSVYTMNGYGNLKIIPVGVENWNPEQVKGQEIPDIQGWYSRTYNTYEPNFTTVYSKEIDRDAVFVWILWPFEKEIPELKTSVFSKNADGVTVKIANPAEKDAWDVYIPFLNKRGVKITHAKK
jgi:hypothetical protein